MAGQTYEKAAKTQIEAGSRDEAANTMVDAFKAFRTEAPADAVRCLEEAIKLFTARGQFRRAANYKMDVAGVLEKDLDAKKEAIAAYQEAGEWYFGDQAEAYVLFFFSTFLIILYYTNHSSIVWQIKHILKQLISVLWMSNI